MRNESHQIPRSVSVLPLVFLFAFSCRAGTVVLFEDTFSVDLSLWTGKNGGKHQGQIVADPLDPLNRVLNFNGLNVSGDIFTRNPINVSGSEQIIVAFDYLGLPQSGSVLGNLGGFIGVSVSLDLDVAWIAGTDAKATGGSGFVAGVELIDDGAWHSYTIDLTDLIKSNRLVAIRLLLEDWLQAGGIPGDAYFDNVRVLGRPKAGNVPPTVRIVRPQDGSTFLAPATLTIEVESTDPDGTVAKVEFVQNATMLGEDRTVPYSLIWTNVSAGSYALTATATDNSSLISTSAPVNIRVNPITPDCVSASGLVSWWRGEGDGGDSFGTNHGSAQGKVTFAPGKVGQAFSFDGNSFVEVPNSPGLNFSATKTMTVELWAYRTGSAAIMHFLGKRVDCGQTHYQLVFDPVRELHFGVKEANVATGIPMPLNTWTHLAATVNGRTMKFYVNGELKATGTADLGADNSAPLRIGRSGSCEFFEGLIDEVAIYNRTLSDAEIQAIYGAGSQGLARSTPPLITVQPLSQTVEAGRSVTLSAAATGTPLLTFQWYFNGTNAMAGATNQNLTLASVQAAQAGRYRVEVRNCAGATNSLEAQVQVNRVNLPPVVAVTNPAHRTIFAPGIDIIISAAATDPDGTVDQVRFYAGSTLLGASTTRPFGLTWRAVAVGDYVLTARAIDNDGASSISEPVKIAVSEDACVASPVALIQTGADPEIEILQDYLFEMGLSAQVFSLAELNVDVLKTYPLSLWVDLGGTQSRVTEREVDILDQLYRTHSRPLYFIGERLAGALTRLREPQQSLWRNLIHLQNPTEPQAGGTVTIEGTGQTDPLHLGRFGTLEDFSVTNLVEAASWASDDSGLLGRVSNAAVLVTYPAWEKPDEKEARTFTQNLRLTGGGDTASVQERKEIFQNAVWWLLRCIRAGNLNLKFEELTATPNPATVGVELTYTIKIGHSGGTQATGVIVTNLLPRAVEFVSAETTQGSWRHEAGRLTFNVGRMTSASTNLIKITVRPQQSGVLTNHVGMRLNEADGKEDNVGMIVTTVEGGPVKSGPRLTVGRSGSGEYELRLEGEAGRSYGIQTSSDLMNWLDVASATGAVWSMPLFGATGRLPGPAFYRAVSR